MADSRDCARTGPDGKVRSSTERHPGGDVPRRLDAYLVSQGLYENRTQAQAALMAGEVEIEGVARPKPGDRVSPGRPPRARVRERPPYVSRGGLKLERALSRWPIPAEGRSCVDLGASTGGFTDCLLQHGAEHVYAVDVGLGQLHPRLRSDPRVTVLDRTNARFLRSRDLPRAVSLVTADLAFISLRLVWEAIYDLLGGGGAPPAEDAVPGGQQSRENGEAICLVKPQFEAGRADIGKHGVVRDPAVWGRVLAEVASTAERAGLVPHDVTPSPIRGPEGNVEFLLWLGVGSTGNPENGPGGMGARIWEAVREASGILGP